jgi:hypothetical protein
MRATPMLRRRTVNLHPAPMAFRCGNASAAVAPPQESRLGWGLSAIFFSRIRGDTVPRVRGPPLGRPWAAGGGDVKSPPAVSGRFRVYPSTGDVGDGGGRVASWPAHGQAPVPPYGVAAAADGRCAPAVQPAECKEEVNHAG